MLDIGKNLKLNKEELMKNVEDKEVWLEFGEEKEREFVLDIASKIGLRAIINPEKKENPYAPDLRIDDDYKIADLKTQETPFFTANKYGYDPRYTVTFNQTDYLEYMEQYPGMDILFWVNWDTLEGYGRKILPLQGVWRCTINDIAQFVKEGARLHPYINRQDDNQGNARESYMLDVRKMKCLWSYEG